MTLPISMASNQLGPLKASLLLQSCDFSVNAICCVLGGCFRGFFLLFGGVGEREEESQAGRWGGAVTSHLVTERGVVEEVGGGHECGEGVRGEGRRVQIFLFETEIPTNFPEGPKIKQIPDFERD